MEIDFAVGGAAHYREVARKLRQAARSDLRKKLRDNIKDAGKPVVAAVRTAVAGVEVESSAGGVAPPDYSRGLRDRIGRATKVSIRANGISIYVSGKQVDSKYGNTLAQGMNASGRWRHPTFGRKPWQSQRGSDFFESTIQRYANEFQQACIRAIDDVARDIAG